MANSDPSRDPDFFKLHYRQWRQRMHRLRVPYDLQGALLCIVNETHLLGAPPPDDDYVLAGCMMVSPRKARAAVDKLASLGLVRIEGGFVVDKTAVQDAADRSALREVRVQSGHKGGVRSGVVRRESATLRGQSDMFASDNTLKSNETGEANSKQLLELEKSRVDTPPTPQGVRCSNGGISRQEIDGAFDRFWAAYPRHETKAKAREKLELVLKRREATADELIQGAASYADRMAAEGRPREKIAHPTTWLNQKRWEDEAEFRRDERLTPEQEARRAELLARMGQGRPDPDNPGSPR